MHTILNRQSQVFSIRSVTSLAISPHTLQITLRQVIDYQTDVIGG